MKQKKIEILKIKVLNAHKTFTTQVEVLYCNLLSTFKVVHCTQNVQVIFVNSKVAMYLLYRKLKSGRNVAI